MSITAALLANLLATNADINYYTQQSIYWNSMYEANNKKLVKHNKYEEQWNKEYDKAIEGEKECKVGGEVYIAKDAGYVSEAQAKRYADAKVTEYDEDLLIELTELDIEYDTMKTMYDTLLEQLRAQQESEKSVVSASAQDTGLINGG